MEQPEWLVATSTAVFLFAVLAGFDYLVGAHVSWLLNGAIAALTGGLVYYMRTTVEPAQE